MEKITLKELFDILDEAEEEQDIMTVDKPKVTRPEEQLNTEERPKKRKKKKTKDEEPEPEDTEDTEGEEEEEKEKPKDNSQDVSSSGKVKAEMITDYRIREDLNHSIIGEYGNKHIIIDNDNYKKMGDYLWETIVDGLDYDFYADKKGNTSLKYYLECDFTITSTQQKYTVRIYFDVNGGEKDKKFKATGWSFNNKVNTSSTLEGLNDTLRKLFETIYTFGE